MDRSFFRDHSSQLYERNVSLNFIFVGFSKAYFPFSPEAIPKKSLAYISPLWALTVDISNYEVIHNI